MLQASIVGEAKKNLGFHQSILGDIRESVAGGALTDADRQQAETIVDIGTVQDVAPDVDARFHGAVELVRKLEAANDGDQLKAIALALGLAPPPGASARQLSALIRIEMARVTTMAPEEQGAFLDRVDGVLKPYEEKQQ
jgi:hypothetical protein